MADTKLVPHRRIDSAGSRYALEVAFRTMQERCHKLQGRLSQLEEENTRLRLSERKDKNDSLENGVQMQSLKDIITQLEQEKKQLSHHVYMVTSENKHLWNCLSNSKEANKLLGNHLTQISDAFTQHPLNRVGDSQIIKKAPSTLVGQAVYSNTSPLHTASETEAKDSLEEISLKLINTFLQEKSELEDQYTQMVALHDIHDNGIPLSFTTDNLSQSLLVDIMNGENGSSFVLSDVKEHRSTLLQMKENLMNQQLQLQIAVENLKKIKPDKTLCQSCKLPVAEFEKNYVSQETALLNRGLVSSCRAKIDSEDSYSESILKQQLAEERPIGTAQNNAMFHPCGFPRNIPSSTDLPQSDTPSLTTSDSNDLDRVCPVCSRAFSFSTSIETLTQHVLSHFESEEYIFVDDSPK